MENPRNVGGGSETRESGSSLYDIFRKNVDENRSYPLVIFHGRHVSHYNILTLADSLAEALKSTLSVGKGDIVGIALPISPQFFVAFIALQKIGGVAVPLDPWMTTREFGNVSTVLKFKSIFIPDTSMIRFEKGDRPESVVVTRIQDFLPFEKSVAYTIRNLGNTVNYSSSGVKMYSFTDLIYGSRGEQVQVDPEKDPSVALISTSRNGKVHAMIFTHSNIMSTASSIAESLPPIKGRFRIATTLPPFAPSAFQFSVILPLFLGGTVTTVLERKNYYRLFHLCSLFDCDFILSSPYDLQRLIDQGLPTLAIKSLRGVLCSSYLLSGDVRDRLSRTYGTHVIEYFGIPEMGGVTHIQSPDRSREKAGSPGRPIPGTEAIILEEKTHKEVSSGVTGELYLKGPGMASTFLPPIPDEESFFHEGYFDSGDLAMVDENGIYFIEERRRDAILSKGVFVNSGEIEDVIAGVPGVKETAVIGIENGKGDQDIIAVVSAESEDRALVSRITRTCREELSSQKIPARIEFRRELPKSMSGRVLKSQLTDEYSSKE